MTGEPPLVLVVDDDASIRNSMGRLLRSAGYAVRAFPSASEFLGWFPGEGAGPRCAVFDVQMPGTSGIELQTQISDRAGSLPIVFVSGHGDIPMGVRAMKDGAVDFLEKPFDAMDLLDAVDRALDRDARERVGRRETEEACRLVARLTPREHEVMRWVIAGFLNKQIAGRLGIAEKTVKVHRGRVMEKTGVMSVADLVRLAERAGVAPAG